MPKGAGTAGRVARVTTGAPPAPPVRGGWATLAVRGGIAYPRPVAGFAGPLGDGTWLTHDGR
ncbi:MULTISPECIES: hypothetical protein [unclassified Streptomyces]|uniref:hypothetical protein n=1 Tax=unclassified Streptomyces TaxID=2593676 RepID=UPI00364E1042